MRVCNHEISTNVGMSTRSLAKFRGDETAIVFGDRRITWAELEARVAKVTNALLDAGLEKGDKVRT